MRMNAGRLGLLDFALGAAVVVAIVVCGCGGGDGASDATSPDVPGLDNPADLPPADQPAGDADADPAPDPGADLGQELPPVTPGVPILDRTPDLRFDCQVTRGITNHTPLAWARSAHPLVTTAAGKVFLARVQSSQPSPFEPGVPSMRVGPFQEDGTLGEAVEIPSVPDQVSGMAAIPAGEGFLLAWAQETVLTALRDGTGAPVAAAKTLSLPSGDYSTRPVLAAQDGGFAMAFSTPTSTGRAVQFTRLDAQGAALGPTHEFPTQGESWGDPGVALAGGGGRWGLLWQESKDGKGRVFFAAVDAAGALVVDRKVVSSTEDDGFGGMAAFSQPRLALIPVATGWLAAWTEAREGADFQSGASALVRLARLDGDGNVMDRAPVRSAVVDRDEVEPVLVPFQGAVGLFWSSGTHIYMCGGCTPDHTIHFVLLDPYTLAPLGAVLSIPPASGGLLGLSATVDGDALLLTTEIGFHVHQEPGSAALTCTAQAGGAP